MAIKLRLFGMKALVTGAVGGIGEAIGRTLVKHGAEVLAIDVPNSGVDTQFRSVRGIAGVEIDLQASDVASQVTEAAKSQFGRMDIVFYDMSPRVNAPINDGDDGDLEAVLQQRQQQVAGICSELPPLMKNSPAGHIVILGYLRSVFGCKGSRSFAKSTAAISQLTARLAAEAGPYGINANYIQPGAIMTPESRKIFSNDRALRDFCIERSAAKRLGEPIDIAKVALFLTTDDSVFVSGTGIVVDGGIAA